MFRSGGSVPLSDLESKLIDVTRFELSHFTPFQLQKLLADHPDGGGLRALANFDMYLPSSAMAVCRRREKHNKSLERETRVFGIEFV